MHGTHPLVQYAIMMDAGSTGSRIHVYKFNYCQNSPELEFEHFDHVEPGLSSYGTDPERAAASLRPLLDKAKQIVPSELHNCTPISLKATAGLRLLGPQQSSAIIDAVRHLLEQSYPFPIADGQDEQGNSILNGVEIMEGRDEGVFAWITVNYLLNLIGTDRGTSTAAVMDLGGGSTQIVFEPSLPKKTHMHPGEHVYELRNFGNTSYTLYQNSYLGYGLKQARQSTNSLATFAHLMKHAESAHSGLMPSNWEAFSADNTHIPNPCYAAGMQKAAKVSTGLSQAREVTMLGTSRGFRACQRLVELMMDKDAECKLSPCSFAGVYQPPLSQVFKHADIIALSYFYDRLTPLGLGPTFTIKELEQMAERVCAPPHEWTRFASPSFSTEALSELQQRADYCLDLTYIHSLLRLGYELEDSRRITLAKKIGDFELGWALGAQLAVLSGGLVCK
ncbi:guanosine-diphosphatase [Malassezia nana]|uniref:guanosine-diphosphatase n=1 Tax=Malassezia nana TaxID=180528 RepID=A0AAF0EJW7_9BASI|nr:guanosine-diphosphatase [Malassezia nana]